MNILMLTYQGDLGGSTQSMIYLSEGLAARGHRVFFGCGERSRIYSILRQSAVKVVPICFSRFGWAAARDIGRLCRQEAIQIVNPQSSQDRYSVMLARFFFGMRAKVVFTRRQMPDSSRLSCLLANLAADRIIAVSGAVAQALKKRWTAGSKITVIHNGTPAEKYESVEQAEVESLRRELNFEPGAVVIGCIARKKRQDVLLEATPYLPAEAVILIVGPGERPEWTELIERIKPSQRIIILGHRERILPFYRLLSVSVLPSLIEGLSQTVLESMAMGVPVVASRWGGNPEVVEDGVSGLLFEPLDPHDLADKVNRVLGDPELADSFKERGRMRALVDFNIQRTIAETEACFEHLLEKG